MDRGKRDLGIFSESAPAARVIRVSTCWFGGLKFERSNALSGIPASPKGNVDDEIAVLLFNKRSEVLGAVVRVDEAEASLGRLQMRAPELWIGRLAASGTAA